MKNNSFSIISLAVSVVSLLVSSYIICSENRFNADWYAIVIGVLSLLVTVLIGWNIYIGIDFDRRIENKVEKALSGIGSEVEYMNDRTTYSLLANIAGIMKEQGNSLISFDMYLKAALFTSKAKEPDKTRDCLKNAIDVFDVMMTNPKLSLDRKIFKSEFRKLDDYIDMLKLIDSKLSNTLITRIVLAKED